KEGVTPHVPVEEELLTPQEISKGVRLSCQAKIAGNCVCVVPQESQTFGDQIEIEGSKGHFPLDPDIRKIALTVPEPQLGEKYFDFEQVLSQLQKTGIRISKYTIHTARQLPALLRNNNFHITAVIDQEHLLTVEPGDTTSTLLGIAFDIGTTTVVAKLLDIKSGDVVAVASVLNPQKAYGADVVSRINYIVEHAGGLELLHRLIIKQMNELVGELCRKSEISPENVYKISVVGNTVMQHIVLNIDPRNVAYVPYTPAFQGPATISAKELGVKINEHGTAYFPPDLGCFVGSDITSMLTVLDIDEQETMQLAVDIGTNGEMVLGSKRKMVCSSSPAGPAWEGAYISWGMRAARGAIERAEIVDGDLAFRTVGEAEPIGICGSGLLDLVCEFVRAGVVEVSGRIPNADALPAAVGEKLKSRIVHRDTGANDISIACIDDEKAIMLTQKDIREVQLAKSAIASGIKILMKELGSTPEDIAAVYIAGGFGNHVRGQDALDSGLIPNVPVENVKFIGNAAIAGAEAMLLSKEAREKAEQLGKNVQYVEVADRKDFHEFFVDSMQFPVGENGERKFSNLL
ncbi:MAG: DUF4445 domain-containing protein, partial [Bacteroidota bacterium]|nr:DUF4445 domain-containing protein [Bacteroidota bacterium]